jgi:hypothetical protein
VETMLTTHRRAQNSCREEAPLPQPLRDIESLIRVLADHALPEDYSDFCRAIPGLRLFLPLVDAAPQSIPRGHQIQIPAGAQLRCRTVSIKGLEFVLAFTSITDARLGANFVEIDGQEALRMVRTMPTVEGLLVQGSGTGWVALDRRKISELAWQRDV